jgi:hypothetical protein
VCVETAHFCYFSMICCALDFEFQGSVSACNTDRLFYLLNKRFLSYTGCMYKIFRRMLDLKRAVFRM